MLSPSSAPGTGTAAARAQYEYEDVKPVGSGQVIHMTSLSVQHNYGVSLHQGRK